MGDLLALLAIALFVALLLFLARPTERKRAKPDLRPRRTVGGERAVI